MKTTIVLWAAVLELCATVPCAAAQTFAFSSTVVEDRTALAAAMPKLAKELIGSYRDADRQRYLDNLFRLQIVAGKFDGAAASLSALRSFDDDASPWSATNYSQYAIFVNAKRLQASGKSFDRAFETSFLQNREEFARIHIPVLSTDGYLAGQNVGGLYYYTQYSRYNPSAEIYFLVGPYDHIRGQRGTVSSLGPDLNVVAGRPIDPAAHIDIESLRYQWFDHIFKGAKKPAILGDRVNYEVMGANEWRHAPTIQAMHDELVTFRLDATNDGGSHRLTQAKTAADAFVSQTIDVADRSDVNLTPPASGLDTHLGLAYRSAPLRKAVDLAGVFSGQLDFVTNKKDMDLNISLYELTSSHEYVGVTYYQARASYVRSRTQRQLLVPGKRTRLDFTSSRLASWRFHAGSRLVVLVSIVKEPDIQINYGTGKDVNDESIADAKVPLKIKWFADSFITMPTWHSKT